MFVFVYCVQLRGSCVLKTIFYFICFIFSFFVGKYFLIVRSAVLELFWAATFKNQVNFCIPLFTISSIIFSH